VVHKVCLLPDNVSRPKSGRRNYWLWDTLQRHARNTALDTYRCFRQQQESEVRSAPRVTGLWVNNAYILEVALADASTLSQAHYAPGHPFRSPKTRRPILFLFSPPGIAPRHHRATHRTIFDELSIARFEKLLSQIPVLRELCLEYHVHRLDVHLKPVWSLVGALKPCFRARRTRTRLRSYKFG